MLIIGSACVIGHMLNKDGKQSRNVNKKMQISPNRLPPGTIIYDSDRVSEVDNYMRNLAAAKHGEKIKQTYPLDYDKPVDIFANDGKGDSPVELLDLSGGVGSAKQHFSNNVMQGVSTNLNAAAYNPENGQAFTTTISNVDSSPMFRTSQLSAMTSEYASPVSLLSGQPLDMTHANMNPMFGKMVKQPGVTNENSQVLLEMYTGMPSTDDQGTYRSKREVENPLPTNPENPQRANMTQISDLYQRASWGVKPSHEFKTPVKAYRDLPMKDDVRIMPASIDEVRGLNNKQVTYSGVMIPGQKGSTRPMLPNMRSNKWQLTSETKKEDLMPGRSAYQGSSSTVIPTVRNNNATQVMEATYVAPPTNYRKITDVGGLSDTYKSQMNESVNKRMESFTPGYGGARGMEKGPNTGVFMMRDPEKGFANERQNQPYQGGLGPRLRNVGTPDATLKDTLAENRVGAINPNGYKENDAWKKQNLRLDVTNKAMNSDNPYRGLPGKNLGMGNRKHKIQQWTTTKETTQFSKRGNPKGSVPAHMSYDSVFEIDTNKELHSKRYGIAKGLNSKQISDGGEIIVDSEKLMVKDYVTLPKGVSHGRNRKEFIDGTDLDYNRIDFGGYFSGFKAGNGDDAKRSGKVQIKEEMMVEGRMNVPLKRDNPNDNMEMEANLKPERETVERKIMQRTQPKEVITDRNPIITRSKNSETINPRLDINTKITLTSDPYPWIKDKGLPEDTIYD